MCERSEQIFFFLRACIAYPISTLPIIGKVGIGSLFFLLILDERGEHRELIQQEYQTILDCVRWLIKPKVKQRILFVD